MLPITLAATALALSACAPEPVTGTTLSFLS